MSSPDHFRNIWGSKDSAFHIVPLSAEDRLWYLVTAGRVKRYHTAPTLASDTVGCHSLGVVLLCEILSEEPARAALLLAAAAHDLPELVTGDIPAPVKRAVGELTDALGALEETILTRIGIIHPELTLAEIRTLKLADIADGQLYCCYERSLGNLNISSVYYRYVEYLETLMPFKNQKEREVLSSIQSIWSRYHYGH